MPPRQRGRRDRCVDYPGQQLALLRGSAAGSYITVDENHIRAHRPPGNELIACRNLMEDDLGEEQRGMGHVVMGAADCRGDLVLFGRRRNARSRWLRDR
jgi:hypothetical protein